METNIPTPNRTAGEGRLACGSLTIVFLLVGCVPSIVIDPAAKADIDARVANLRVSSTVVTAPPPDLLESSRPAVGQWVQYKVSLLEGGAKFVTEKIIGEEGGALWYEEVEDTYEGRVVQQLLFAVDYDGTGHAKVELRAARTKDEKGRIVTLSRAALWEANHGIAFQIYWARAVGVANIRHWPALPHETTAVPAGRFEGCYREHEEHLVGRNRGQPWIVDAWSHPDVPLSGLVRRDGHHGIRGVRLELVGYGVTGARSDF